MKADDVTMMQNFVEYEREKRGPNAILNKIQPNNKEMKYVKIP